MKIDLNYNCFMIKIPYENVFDDEGTLYITNVTTGMSEFEFGEFLKNIYKLYYSGVPGKVFVGTKTDGDNIYGGRIFEVVPVGYEPEQVKLFEPNSTTPFALIQWD